MIFIAYTPATHCVLSNIPAYLLVKPVRIELESCDLMFEFYLSHSCILSHSFCKTLNFMWVCSLAVVAGWQYLSCKVHNVPRERGEPGNKATMQDSETYYYTEETMDAVVVPMEIA